ncbi:MAG: hypothetical protein NUV91_04045 [Candidatus Omnitrophica bacterium]|nr:hypothetical protein [Candidatus Omnitrophota bacterium]
MLILGLLLPAFLGHLIVQLILRRQKIPFLCSVALGYGIGTGILTHLMLVLGFFHIPYTFRNITSFLIVLAIPLMIFFIKMQRKSLLSFSVTSNPSQAKPSWIELTLIGYIFFQAYFILLSASTIPVLSWDSVASHSFIAKIIFYDRSLIHHLNFPHTDYPIHTPLLESWVTIAFGKWDDIVINIPFPLTLMCLAIFIYFFLIHFTSSRWALSGVALLLTSNLLIYHASIPYRDLPLLYYSCIAIMSLILWYRSQEQGWIWVAAIFSGLGSFVKVEGYGYVGLHIAIFCFLLWQTPSQNFKNKIFSFGKFLLPAIGITSIYLLYKHFVFPAPEISSVISLEPGWRDIRLALSQEHFEHIPTVLGLILKDLFLSGNWNMTWFLLLISVWRWVTTDTSSKEIQVLLLTLAFFIAASLFLFSFTQHYIWFIKGTVLSRLILHFYPLAVILIILINTPSKFKSDKNI